MWPRKPACSVNLHALLALLLIIRALLVPQDIFYIKAAVLRPVLTKTIIRIVQPMCANLVARVAVFAPAVALIVSVA